MTPATAVVPPLFRVEKGDVQAEHLAALTAVLFSRTAAATSQDGDTSREGRRLARWRTSGSTAGPRSWKG